MIKKFFGQLKEKIVVQAKDIAMEQANDLITKGTEQANKRVQSFLGIKNEETKEEMNNCEETKVEIVSASQSSESSDISKYQNAEQFEQNLQKGLTEVAKNFATANPKEALEAINKLTNMAGEVAKFTEVQKTRRKEIEAQRDIIVEQIKSRKEIILLTLEKTFDERKDMFKKYFDIVDDALAKDNIELLKLGLGSINNLAATSPFKALESIESTQKALGDSNHTWNF